jgi:hypothetical protein
MPTAQAKKLIIVNLGLWLFAMLLHPFVRILPTGSGAPPKIFDLLIPLLFIMLAGGSTYLLKCAIGNRR